MMFVMQKQAYRHDPARGIWGDCHRTCIANLLGVPRDEVPHSHEELLVEDWTALIDDYLADRSLREIRIHLQGSKEEIVAAHGSINIDILYIMSGATARDTTHSVLFQGGVEISNPGLEDQSDLVGPMNPLGYGVSYVVPRHWKLETPTDWEPLIRSWRLDSVINPTRS